MTIQRASLIAGLFKDLSTVGRIAMHRTFRGGSDVIQSRTKIGILFVLSKDGSQSLKDLADHFHMSSSAATQTIDELERDGLVVRRVDADDRRKVAVLVTAKGKSELGAAKRSRLAQMKQILEALSDDELVQLRSIQQKIVRRLEELHCKEIEPKGEK